jgi:hypothetical protein
MRLEIFILGLTAFFIYNAYHDGKYLKIVLSFKKYYKMIFFAVIGISIYLLLKKNPAQSKNMLLYANNMVKYMPIDRNTMDLITPIFDFTNSGTNLQNSSNSFMESFNEISNPGQSFQEQRILSSGKTGTKRSVSETKKKYVASQQEWKCGHCDTQLNAWFEVDHKIRLEHGGGNDVQNLVALCRECHGKKTAMENM